MKRGHRDKRSRRTSRAALTAFCVALAAVMLGLIGYVAYWYWNLGRIQSESERYAQLYTGREAAQTPAPTAIASATPAAIVTASPTAPPNESLTEAPTQAPATTPTQTPTAEPTPVPTAKPTQVPTAEPTSVPTAKPTQVPTAEPTPVPTAEPTSVPTEDPTRVPTPTPTQTPASFPADLPGADMPIVEDIPIPTPGLDTVVISLPTAPPIQDSFSALLGLNPETVGFLDIEGMLSLPVVQRQNDNDFYLSHSFEGRDAKEGTLFLDGLNRLVPEDDCLIVYGHNMKNNTMFGKLSAYGDIAYLRRHPIVHFDTLYENRSYVAFAAFSASMEAKDRRYFDVRNFIFDEDEFDKFVLKLQSRSLFSVPVDVSYGDRLLLLVTCDYTNREGRFILALRQVRQDESEGNLWAAVMQGAQK